MILWRSVAFLVLAFPFFCRAERILSEKEILARCYAHLTGQRLSISSPLWSQLTPGQTGSALCLSLLNDVQLGSNGVLTQSTSLVHRRILKQFHDFHRSWFATNWSYDASFPDVYQGTVDIYDGAEPSMYITRALFSQTALPYSSIVTGNTSLEAVRDSSGLSAYALGASGLPRATKAFYAGETTDPNISFPTNIINTAAIAGQDSTTNFSIPATLAQIGQLTGIRPVASDSQISTLWADNFSSAPKMNPTDVIRPQMLHQNFGGGALGSIPYLLMNFGQPYGYTATGAQKLPRRAIMAAFNTFMCLSGPFTRVDDVGSYLSSSSDPNSAPFRHSTACLRCHATMDQSAMTLRNLRLGGPANTVVTTAITRIPAMVVNSTADMSATSDWPDIPNPTFYRTPPTGKLFFRSVNGQLISQNVNDLNGLGNALASTDDLYACAAKRYFKYFTGIDIPLFDPYDPANAPSMQAMTDKEKEYRSYILNLGRELKASGSLRDLIKTIVQSDYYKLAGFGR